MSETMVLGRLGVLACGVTTATHPTASRSWAITDCTRSSGLHGAKPSVAAPGASRHRQALLTHRLCWAIGRFFQHIVPQLCYAQKCNHTPACLYFVGATEWPICIIVARYIAGEATATTTKPTVTSHRARLKWRTALDGACAERPVTAELFRQLDDARPAVRLSQHIV